MKAECLLEQAEDRGTESVYAAAAMEKGGFGCSIAVNVALVSRKHPLQDKFADLVSVAELDTWLTRATLTAMGANEPPPFHSEGSARRSLPSCAKA